MSANRDSKPNKSKGEEFLEVIRDLLSLMPIPFGLYELNRMAHDGEPDTLTNILKYYVGWFVVSFIYAVLLSGIHLSNDRVIENILFSPFRWIRGNSYPSDDKWEAIGSRSELTYDQYLMSEEWEKRRDFIVARAGKRCQLCNSPHQLNVHHRTYERLGAERIDDLIALCRECHEEFHDSRKLYKG